MDTTEFRARPLAGSNDLHLFADHGGALLERIGTLSDYRGDLIFTSDDDDLQGAVMWDWAPGMKTSDALVKVKAEYLALREDRRRQAEAEHRDAGAVERMMDAWASQDRQDLELHDALHPEGYATPYLTTDWGPYDGLEDTPAVPR